MRFTKSIRWRLQLWLAFLLVCILSGFGITAYQLHRTNRLSQVDEELERRVAALSAAVRGRPPFGDRGGPPPFGERPGRLPYGERGPYDEGPGRGGPRRGHSDLFGPGGPAPGGFRGMGPGPREVRLSSQVLSLFDESDTNGFYFAIWSREGTVLKRATNAPTAVSLPERPGSDTRTHTQTRDAYREAFHFTELGDCVLAGRAITADLAAMRQFAGWLVAAGAAVLALGLWGGWLLATRAIRPVEVISATASRISEGNLSERISVANTDNELGHLAGVLNSTFARLEAAFAQQKQFTADASHELRTPLTVLISEAQTALARDRSAAEYRETVEACLDAAQQMRRLAESLLQLARFDAGQERMERNTIDLAETTRVCVERLRPLTDRRRIQVHCDLAPAETLGDADRLSQVITNFLTNAIQYNKDNGEIRVRTGVENGAAVLTVTDTGIGIAAEDLPRIFERFYRADKSRARADGRSGLGLAICKAIVDAHGGTIEVTSRPGDGTTITVRFPPFERV